MARRGSRASADANAIASLDSLDRLLAPPRVTVVSVPSLPVRSDWSLVEDLRRFDFNAPEARARSAPGLPATVRPVVSGVSYGQLPPGMQSRVPAAAARFSFENPEKVMVCVRRKERREVLFATDRRSRGRGGSRRRTPYSDVECK